MVPLPHQHPHLEPSDSLDALYCSEEHWEEETEESEERDFPHQNPVWKPFSPDLSWESDELSSLLSKEKPNELYKALCSDPCVDDARRAAVEWILRVNAHYSFSPVTAILAVDFFDRFLSCFHFQRDKPWMSQLAAVACISLAAKVEETDVPLLLDLQVEESGYLFEAKTIKKMEILVLSTLQWRMNPVTPFSFVDYFARRLGFNGYICSEMLRQCENTLLSAILYSSFTSFLPSVIATATMLHVFTTMESDIGLEYHNQLLEILGTDKDNVDECCKFITKASVGQGNRSKKRKFGSIPGSPTGVVDMSFSSDSSNDSWSASSSPEPLSKKNRAPDKPPQSSDRATASNFLNIPR